MHRSILGTLLLATLPLHTGGAQEIVEPGATGVRAEMMAAMEAQDWDKVLATANALIRIDEQDGQAWYRKGFALHAMRRYDQALECHIRAAGFPKVGPTAAYNAACVYALTGRPDQAFAWLEKAVEKGFTGKTHMATDPDMDSLREDPRYARIVASIRLTKDNLERISVYSNQVQRQAARLSYWSGSTAMGQVVLDYGPAVWKEKYSKRIASGELDGVRWRLGNDFWTHLDTNVAVTIGGQPIPPGLYYLTLERRQDGRYLLAFIDPEYVRARKLDAFAAMYTRGGIEVEMTYSVTRKAAERLAIEWVMKGRDRTKGELVIRYGPHQVAAPVVVDLLEG